MVDTRSRRLLTGPGAAGTSRQQREPGGNRDHRRGAERRPQPTHTGPHTEPSVSSNPNRQREYSQRLSQQRDMDLVHMEQDEFEFLQANKDRLLVAHQDRFQEFLRRRREKRPVASEEPRRRGDQQWEQPPSPKRRGIDHPRREQEDAHQDVESSASQEAPRNLRGVSQHRRQDKDDALEKDLQEALKPLRQGYRGSPFVESIYNLEELA